jgi:hypothetical protein
MTQAIKYICVFVMLLVNGCGTRSATGAPEKTPELPVSDFIEKQVVSFNASTSQRFVNNHQVYSQGWDTLPQAKFWQDVIALSHDSMIMNIAGERKSLFKVATNEWHCQSESEKDIYKRNICISNNIHTETNLYVTSGKKFFFEFRRALPMIAKAIPVFESAGADPWYAQTILLIESPGKTEAVSYVGARGPFQLMPYVARKYGLVVSRTRDDRTHLEKSAAAAAKFISGVCVPAARKILDNKGISYNENDLWFRLFVMHTYHAGAGNVNVVINKINPHEGGMQLIRTMWQTEAGGFKNESQNYSQIALASIICFDRLIGQDADSVFMVHGDRKMKLYFSKDAMCVDTLAFLQSCITSYETDLVEGVIPFEYFVSSVEKVKKEIKKVNARHGIVDMQLHFAESERLFRLGDELMYKRKFNDAVAVFQLGLSLNPIAPGAYDSLSKAYRSLGNTELALKYSKKSKEVVENLEVFLK